MIEDNELAEDLEELSEASADEEVSWPSFDTLYVNI
jgi:hypothetical protein